MKRRYPGSRNPVVNSTNFGGRLETCVAKRMRGCLPPRSGCGWAATSSPRNALSLPVGMRVSHESSAVSRAGTRRSLCQPVFAEMFTRGAQATWARSRSISFSSWCRRSSSTWSHLLKAITRARPASSTICRMRTSCSEITDGASSSTTATSARSRAEAVRREA